ncbi:MAG: gliding motility-associated C-terminal domain-containing protein [Bacteroidota bacterium]|nr:gliding motility-associated C-terminal domain-containing protein [Bacteroidota bacterium]
MSAFIFIVGFIMTSFAQNPETPEIQFVTINQQTQKPTVTWSVQNSSEIDGFIIKRYIYNYQNTFGYNTIHIIDDPNVRTYTDLSTVYGEAYPQERQELYRVAAYDSIGNLRYLSPMSEVHGTIFLSGNYNYCERAIHLAWTEYFAWSEYFEQYKVYSQSHTSGFLLVSTSQFSDTLSVQPAESINQEYEFYIVAENQNGHSSVSNILTVLSESEEWPEFLTITKLSNKQAGMTQIEITADETPAVEQYVLQAGSGTLPKDTIKTFSADGSEVYTVEMPRANYSAHYNFQVSALDYCPESIAKSSVYTDLLAEGKESVDELYTNLISVSEFDEQPDYDLFRKFNASPYEFLTQLQNQNYSDSYYESMTAQLNTDIQQGFYYYYCRTEYSGTEYLSNEVWVKHKAKLIKYNTINPLSTNGQDNELLPFVAFLTDYQMTIYSKQGKIIFESKNPQVGWKGTGPSGEIVPVGSYVYYIKYTDAYGKTYTEKDYVNVVY